MKAILFDMDGVLINSERYYMNGTFEWMKQLGYTGTFTEVCTILGTTLQRTYEIIYDLLDGQYSMERIIEENDRYFIEHALDYKTLIKEGAISLLQSIKNDGLKIALCSSSPRENIDHVVDVCGFAPYLDFIVSGEQFEESKPHPEIYLHAAEVLSVNPEDCLVIEDSEYGIQAGISAGMKVIALSDSELPNKQEKATWIVDSLDSAKVLIESCN